MEQGRRLQGSTRKWGALALGVVVAASVIVPTTTAQAATIDLQAELGSIYFSSWNSQNDGVPTIGMNTGMITVDLPPQVTSDFAIDDLYWAITGTYSFVVPPTPISGTGSTVAIGLTPGELFASEVPAMEPDVGEVPYYKLLVTNFDYATPVQKSGMHVTGDKLIIEADLPLVEATNAPTVTFALEKPDAPTDGWFIKDYEYTVTADSPVSIRPGDLLRIHSTGFDWADMPDPSFGGKQGSVTTHLFGIGTSLSVPSTYFDGDVLQFSIPSSVPSIILNAPALAFFSDYRNATVPGPRSIVSIGFDVAFADPVSAVPWKKVGTPTVSGAKVGSEATVKLGTWSPVPTTVEYQWLLDGEIIPEATDPIYVPSVADFGSNLSVQVTAKRDEYVDQVKTSKTVKVAAGAFAASVPTLSGGTQVGDTLTADAGVWDPEAALTYVWLRSGKVISGATADEYTLVTADRGKTIQVRVIGEATGYAKATKTSAKTAKVGYGAFSGGSVSITGPATVGETLTASLTGVSPAPATVKYQWYVNGKAVSKATKAEFVIPGSALFGQVTVMATASLTGYTAKKYTVSPGVLNPGPAAAGSYSVAFSGVAQVGKTVKATVTGPTSGAKLNYQWMLNGVPIVGATKSSYKLTASAAGLTLGLALTVTKPGATVFYTLPYLPGPVLSGYKAATPKINYSGTLKAGTVLSVQTGKWSPTPVPAFEYTWYRGTTVVGTEAYYTVQAADKGKTLKVTVSVPEGDGYAAASTTSKATSKVK